jgi:1,4-alpha-glucan branching enzyme
MIAPANVMRALSAIYLLLPQTPMIFMGEEWGAQQPFPFFCDFDGDLAEAVREGRREEFARFPEFADPEQRTHSRFAGRRDVQVRKAKLESHRRRTPRPLPSAALGPQA